MSGKLSERFSQLKKGQQNGNGGGSNNRADKARSQRVQKNVQSQANKRGQQLNQRRTGLNTSSAAQGNGKKNRPASAGSVRINRPKVDQKNQKKRPDSAARGGPKGRGNQQGKGKGRRGGDKKEKPAPVTPADLDKQMAAYWHKAGKGPDPDKMELDQALESYRAAGAAESS